MSKLYTCPMHPDVMEGSRGICPKCKMGLVKANSSQTHELHHSDDSSLHHNHDKHAGHSVSMFRDKFWVSLLLTLPVLAYSTSLQQWFGFTPPSFPGHEYVPFVFSTIIFFYGGMVFLKSSLSEILSRMPGMMTLISLAIVTAYTYSVATQFFISGEGFFWELATLIVVMLLGHWLEMAAVEKAGSALKALSKLLPDTAERLTNGKTQTVGVERLVIGDRVLVRPGSRVPVDGIVVSGTSSVDESVITGESKSVYKVKKDEVIAGTLNQEGALTIEVTKLGKNTVVSGIMRLVADAQNSKTHTQVLADKAAFALTLVAIGTSLLTFIYWFFTIDTAFALERSVTVLIIACPHALGLAIPLVVSISTSLSASNGLLVRKRYALESAKDINTVMFDKTGTLTEGKHGVTDVLVADNFKKDEVISIAAGLESKSEHIIAKGIVRYAEDKKINPKTVSGFTILPGQGVRAKIGGKLYEAVSYRYLTENSIELPGELAMDIKKAAKEGKTEVYILKEGKVAGAIALADMVRQESKQALSNLRNMGIKTVMITGDSAEVAEHVANVLGVDEYFAEVKPKDKSDKVKQLQSKGKKVAMVGDGVNDAPALAQADIGLAIGAGTDVAVKSADIVLVRNDPRDIVKIVKLSSATYSKMKQNLVWATGYNVLAIPLAAGILYNQGIVLAPALGAALMSLSTVIVAFNAQLLRKVNL